MLCTVREGKSGRVIEEGEEGEKLGGRESRASKRRKRRGSEWCEPRLQPTRYRSRKDRSVEERIQGYKLLTYTLLLCQLKRKTEVIPCRFSSGRGKESDKEGKKKKDEEYSISKSELFRGQCCHRGGGGVVCVRVWVYSKSAAQVIRH